MTKEEFIAFWMRNSGFTSEQVEELCFEARLCDCGELGCQGWQMDINQERLLKKIREEHLH